MNAYIYMGYTEQTEPKLNSTHELETTYKELPLNNFEQGTDGNGQNYTRSLQEHRAMKAVVRCGMTGTITYVVWGTESLRE